MPGRLWGWGLNRAKCVQSLGGDWDWGWGWGLGSVLYSEQASKCQTAFLHLPLVVGEPDVLFDMDMTTSNGYTRFYLIAPIPSGGRKTGAKLSPKWDLVNGQVTLWALISLDFNYNGFKTIRCYLLKSFHN